MPRREVMNPKTPMRRNFTYTGYEHPEIGAIRDLAVYVDGQGAIWSTWRPTFWEWLRLVVGFPIVVGVLSNRQPPMSVMVGEDREL